MLWRLLLQTFPEGKWVIILVAWLTYSFSQEETLLRGSDSLAWYLAILMVVMSIYFLNKIKYSSTMIIPAIICGFVGTFSIIIGVLVWIVGLLSFRNLSRWKLLALYVISGTTAFVLFFNSWKYPSIEQPHAIVSNPIELLTFVLVFLGNLTRLRLADNMVIPFSGSVGVASVGVFIAANLLYRHYHVGQNSGYDARPWFQFAIFGILCGIMASIGKLGLFGINQALASRYVPLSNFFIDGTLVITLMTLFYLKKITNSTRNRHILQSSIVILIILVSIDIVLGNIVGLLTATIFRDKIIIGSSCLMNFESASDDCLHKLNTNATFVRENAKFLHDFCLGPFASKCK